MKKKIKYETCPFCNGTGKVRDNSNRKKIRKKCKDCGEWPRDCFGPGRKDGYGYDYCWNYEDE